jgi:hypothetical protein
MAGDDVLLPQLHFLTFTFPQFMQYHASHAMTGLEEGGDGGVIWTWLDDISDGCGVEVSRGGVDTALPQVRFKIAQARDCMIEHEGETR